MNVPAEWLDAAVAVFRNRPFLLLLAIGAPLVVLAWRTRTYPHRPLVVLLALPSLLTVAMLLVVELFPVVVALDLAVLLLAIVDLVSLPRGDVFSAARQVGLIASLAKSHPVTLVVGNHGTRRVILSVRDGVPQEFRPLPAQFLIRLGGRSRATVHYEMKASRRGAFRFTTVHLRIRSRLGLWQRYVGCPVASTVHVYPDMKQLSEYAVLARTNRLSLLGVRRTRRIGQDNEFERLRDYTRDDNPKHIAWRATARRHALTVKDFQSNQSQRLIFLIDCGRMMTNLSGELSLLDHALNSMLMLSHVALSQGDSVGLLCFSDEIHSFVPPRSGMNQMNRLLHASFDRFPQMVESRYDQAFLYLSGHCRKRSLVILISNVIDEVNARAAGRYLSTLVGRHLPLGVLLRDHRLFDPVEAPLLQGEALYRAAAAAEILIWRHQVLTDLVHKGVLAVDVFPENLTAPLVNQYLEIKARHLL